MPARQIDAFITERVTFKKFKLNQTMSDETPCYSADVYVDGVMVGFTSNHGHGGPDMEHFTPDGEAKLQSVADSIESCKVGDKAHIEVLLHGLVWQMADAKYAARQRKAGFAITVVFAECGGSMIALASSEQVAEVVAKHGTDGGVYRVIGEDFPVVEHATAEDMALVYLAAPLARNKRPALRNEATSISFVTGEVEHRFTDEAHTDANGRMFDRFVAVTKTVQQAA